MTDVVGKLWGFCNVLRHDGMDYGDYIEQLTYLLFLKMADERGIDLPTYAEANQATGAVEQISCDWPYLRKQSGTTLTTHYIKVLTKLGTEHGIFGDIFAGAQSRFTKPTNMSTLIRLIDDVEWTALDVDVKAAAFEGLLEKAAAEGKKGAGQYFTPRILIEAIVRCMRPDPRGLADFTITDPACGTGGFLVGAYEWLKDVTEGGALDRDTAIRVRQRTYYGKELVERPRRLALLNMYLHLVEPHITLGDSIYEVPTNQRFDVVLTNPPFGIKGADQAPVRPDFTVQTSNKQLNFVQHVMTILKRGGRAAMVVPDNVLFATQAGEIFKILLQDCDLHTVLRCPNGTFNPYTDGTKTNVIFFTKGRPTKRTWIYDARASVPKVTKKNRPLAPAHFAEFERCFGADPNGQSPRSEADSSNGRWQSFTIDEIKERNYKLDSFKWIRDEEVDDLTELPEPEELLTDAMEELTLAIDGLADLQKLMEGGNGETFSAETWHIKHKQPEWRYISAQNICAKVQSGGTPKTGFTDEPGIPFLKVYNIVDQHVDFSYRPQYVPEDVHRGVLKKSIAYPGDVIMNIVGPPLGKVAIIPDTYPEWNLNQAITIFRPSPEVLSEWLYMYLCSGIFLDDEDLVTRGSAGQSNISLTQCRNLIIPVPSLGEQREIIRRISDFSSTAEMLSRHVATANRAFKRASQAILTKTFRGDPADAPLLTDQ